MRMICWDLQFKDMWCGLICWNLWLWVVHYRVIQRHKTARWVITLALRVIRGSIARRSGTRAPEKHAGTYPTSGVYPDGAWGPCFGVGTPSLAWEPRFLFLFSAYVTPMATRQNHNR